MGNTYTLLAEPSSIVADEDGSVPACPFYADNWVMDDPGQARYLEIMLCPLGCTTGTEPTIRRCTQPTIL